MQLQRVVSSTIEAAGYDNVKSSMFIQFKDGSLYEYEQMPFAIFQRFMGAPSKGSFLSKLNKSFKAIKLK